MNATKKHQASAAKTGNGDEIETEEATSSVFGYVHRMMPVAVLCVELLVLGVGGVHLWESFGPDPVLVYAVKNNPLPGNVVIETEFKNVNRNWPLEKLSARWELESDDVKIALSPNAPHYVTDEPDAKTRAIALTEPLVPFAHFTTFLQANHSFQIFRQEFNAVFPKVEKSGLRYQRVEVLSEPEWLLENRPPYFLLFAFFVCLTAIVVTGYKVFRLFGRKGLSP